MPAIARKTQKIFGGSLTPTGTIAKFGSLAAAAPAYSGDIAQIQTPAWLNGLAAALINAPGGLASPALEDFNGIFYTLTTQIAYLLQSGIPEWDTDTTYFQYNFVRIGLVVYVSKTNDNQGNNPLVDANNWQTYASTLNNSQSLAKAWVCFDGTTGAITSAFNVSSVTRSAAGAYTINFQNPLANAGYAMVGMVGTASGRAFMSGDDNVISGGAPGRPLIKTTTQAAIFCFDGGSGAMSDSSAISVLFFGT